MFVPMFVPIFVPMSESQIILANLSNTRTYIYLKKNLQNIWPFTFLSLNIKNSDYAMRPTKHSVDTLAQRHFPAFSLHGKLNIYVNMLVIY